MSNIFRINDIVFDVPPSDISIDHVDLTYDWEALRSRHATKIKTGKGECLIGIRLTILPKEVWKLHRLLVEFKNTPFWEIENDFVRGGVLGGLGGPRMAVAAEAMTVGSIQKLPGTWQVELNLKWFNYFPYGRDFLYRKDWVFDNGKHGTTTIYDIALNESEAEKDWKRASEPARLPLDQALGKVTPDEPFIKLENSVADLADLNPLPWEEPPTSPVGADDADLYKCYINYLQARELETFFYLNTVNNVINKSYIDGRAEAVPYPASAYLSDTSVTFSWREFMVIPPIEGLGQLLLSIVKKLGATASQPITGAPPVDDMQYTLPVRNGRVTSKFGTRLHPIDKQYKLHEGVDIGAPDGVEENQKALMLVLSPDKGVVTHIDIVGSTGLGKYVKILDDQGNTHTLAHLSQILPSTSVGMSLRQTQPVGYMGETGKSTGYHVHWQVNIPGVGNVPPNGLKVPETGYTSTIAVEQIPDLLSEEEMAKLSKEARGYLDSLKAQGWYIYRSVHVSNVLFRQVSLRVASSGTGEDDTICTGMGAAYRNRVVSIPIVGQEFPTCQSLGGYDNNIHLTFASVTQGDTVCHQSASIQAINGMISTLERNARAVRMIPDSWTVSVDSFITRISGHKLCVVERARSDTQPNNPGLSTLELTLTSSLPKPDEKLMRSGSFNTDEAIKRIMEVLLRNIDVTIGETRFETAKPPPGLVSEWVLWRKFPHSPTGGGLPERQVTTSVTDKDALVAAGWVVTEERSVLNPGRGETWNRVRGEIIGKPYTKDPAKWLLTDSASYKSSAFSVSGTKGTEGTVSVLRGGQEATNPGRNEWFVVYENTAPESDTFLHSQVDEAIRLLKLCSFTLSDAFWGGLTKQELQGIADLYGLEKWTLPSHEVLLSSQTFLSVLSQTTSSALQGDISTLSGYDGTMAFLDAIAGGSDPSLKDILQQVVASIMGGSLTVGKLWRRTTHWDPRVLPTSAEDEAALAVRLRQVISGYFNRTWLSPDSYVYVQALQRPEFEEIYEKLTMDRITSESCCYPDLQLPAHPYFKSSLFTFPDFYFYNAGTDNHEEDLHLEDEHFKGQVETIVKRSHAAMKALESGTLDKIGGTELKEFMGPAVFEGSDVVPGGKPFKTAKKEIEEVKQHLITEGGHLEIRNKTGLLEKNPTLDHTFDLSDRSEEGNLTGLAGMALESLGDLERRKLLMRRAFPTFKLFFIEEDRHENSWRALDDFYSYNAIRSISLTRSAKVPADLLVVELQNVSGVLDGTMAGGIRDIDYNTEQFDKAGNPTDETKLRERLRSNELENTEMENFFNSLVLREGVNVQLRLGYANHPEFLETVFNGRVVETQWNDTSDVIRVVCQSFATELVQVQKGVTGEDLNGETATDHKTLSFAPAYENTTELLSELLKSPEVLHFGRWQFGVLPTTEEVVAPELDRKQYTSFRWAKLLDLKKGWANFAASNQTAADFQKASTTEGWGGPIAMLEGIALMDLAAPTALTNPVWGSGLATWAGGAWLFIEGAAATWKDTKFWFQRRWKAHKDNPVDNNIFAPHPDDYADYGLLDWTGKILGPELEYHLSSTTIWDTFQEMTYRHPGWIASPVPYGDRMTMFFGVPSQRYWALDASMSLVKRIQELREEVSKTDPKPEAVSEYLKGLKLRFRPFRRYHLWTSQTDIIANDISVSSTGVANTAIVQYADYVRPEEAKTEIMKLHPLMPDEDISTAEVDFENCYGRELAFRYGLKAIVDSIKEMYKGTITVLGDPLIKPYDIGIVADSYSDIAGPVEVEEVTHIFSPDTGFVSVVIPKAYVVVNEISSTPLLDAMLWGALRKGKQLASATHQWLNEPHGWGVAIGAVATAALVPGALPALAESPAVAPPIALGVGAVWGALAGGASYILNPGKKTPVLVIPLTNHGLPMVAGLPEDLPECLWHRYLGDWKRMIYDINAGVQERLMAGALWGYNLAGAYDENMNLVEKLIIDTTGPAG